MLLDNKLDILKIKRKYKSIDIIYNYNLMFLILNKFINKADRISKIIFNDYNDVLNIKEFIESLAKSEKSKISSYICGIRKYPLLNLFILIISLRVKD